MLLRTLIVDDEPVARKVLREELEQIEAVKVVGEAEDGQAAVDAICELGPHLVFLDLQMPRMSGFDVIRKIRGGERIPVIVIVTAYDKHAIEAFDAGAIDYLLKPVTQERLEQAVARAASLCSHPNATAEALVRMNEVIEAPFSRVSRKIVARSGEEYLLLNADEVYAFAAEGDLVWIITARKRYLATQPLKVIQEKLQNTAFRRIHRSALVNIDHVRKMSALTSQRWLVTLDNNQEFIVSKRQARAVRELLSW
jgi:two-component system, LytTR family, response regulator